MAVATVKRLKKKEGMGAHKATKWHCRTRDWLIP